MTYPADIHKPGQHGDPPRSDSASESPQPVSSLVQKGRVVDVNIRDYTVDVSAEHTFVVFPEITFLSPYCHFINGEGMNFMPEVGSVCYVCTPSEERGTAFVLGWVMPDDDGGGYRGSRPLLNPGDLHFSTRDGNFVIIRRGGVVQIGATEICQAVFIPIRNIMELFAENFGIHTPAGDLTWSVFRQDEDGDGHKRTLLTIEAHEFSDDPIKNAIVRIRAGSHGDGEAAIFSIETRDSGGGSVKQSISIAKSGDVKWKMNKFEIQAESDVLLKGKGKLNVETQGAVGLKSEDSVVLVGKTMGIGVGSSADPNAAIGNSAFITMGNDGTRIFGPKLELLGGSDPVMRKSADFDAWVAQVTSLLSAAGPVLGMPGLTAPTQHANPKVKV